MRYIVGLALGAVLALALSASGPATVEAGGNECPPGYLRTNLDQWQNHPYLGRATRVDERGNDNGWVCYRGISQSGRGPLFVDDNPQYQP